MDQSLPSIYGQIVNSTGVIEDLPKSAANAPTRQWSPLPFALVRQAATPR
jgi:hypothetical protein